MSPVIQMVAEAEALGVTLRLTDGKVKASFPAALQGDVSAILAQLRAKRSQLVEALGRRERPEMPAGVKLVEWNLKQPPVIPERVSVVNNVELFVRTTLRQLEFALTGKHWLAGNRHPVELVELLHAVGVVVEILPVRNSE